VQNLSGDPELSFDLFRLVDRLKQMERWRINLASRKTSQRFDHVRTRMMERLDTEAKDDISEICVKEIR
jgi:CRP-like cAMP-binding protein